MVAIWCPCQLPNVGGTASWGSAVLKARSRAGKILLEEENGSWPAMGIGYSPVPESWEEEHEMGNPDAYARLANESRSSDLKHDRRGGDGGCSISPCSGIIVALCCRCLPEDNPRGCSGNTAEKSAGSGTVVCASLLVGRFRWSSVSMGLEWC